MQLERTRLTPFDVFISYPVQNFKRIFILILRWPRCILWRSSVALKYHIYRAQKLIIMSIVWQFLRSLNELINFERICYEGYFFVHISRRFLNLFSLLIDDSKFEGICHKTKAQNIRILQKLIEKILVKCRF